MDWVSASLFIIILALVYFSLKARVKTRMFREAPEMPEFKTSYLSEAITNLVATAGGIYIAIYLMVNFLKLEVPEKVFFWGLSIEPIAGFAFFAALVQPIILRWWESRRVKL